MVKPHATSIPILWGHGKLDRLITYELGQFSTEYLTNIIGVPRVRDDDEGRVGLDFRGYDDVGHYLSQEMVKDFNEWLSLVVPSFD